jgi:hypothetical protein
MKGESFSIVLRTADGREHGRASAETHMDGLTVHVKQLESIPVPDIDLHRAKLVLVADDDETSLVEWEVPSNAVHGDSLSITPEKS